MNLTDLLDLFQNTLNLMEQDEKQIPAATSKTLKKCDLAITGVKMALQNKVF